MIGKVNSKPASGTELNLAFSDTAPSDTQKLWVQAQKPYFTQISDANNLAESTPDYYIGTVTAKQTNVQPVALAVGKSIYMIRNGLAEKYNTDANTYTALPFTADEHALTMRSMWVRGSDNIYMLGYYYADSTYYMYLIDYNCGTNQYTARQIRAGSSLPAPFVSDGNVCVISGSVVYCAASGQNIGIYNLNTNTFSTSSYILTGFICTYGEVGFVVNNEENIILFNVQTLTSTNLGTIAKDSYKYARSVCVCGEILYIVSGYNNQQGATYPQYQNCRFIRKFNIATGSSEGSLSYMLPYGIWNASLCYTNGFLYILGGYYKTGSSGGGQSATHYIPDVHRMRAVMLLQNNCCLIQLAPGGRSVKLFADSAYSFDALIGSVWIGNQQGEGEEVNAYVHDGQEWIRIN